MSTPFAVFGPGILIMTRTDISPGIAVNVGYVNEFTLDFAGTSKQLYGQFQFPLVVARGTIKATGKMKNATVSGLALNALFFGGTPSTGAATGQVFSWNIASTLSISTSTAAGQQVGSSLTFDADLGVTYVDTGLPLQRVSTGLEAVGKYSITAGSPGLYNFVGGETTSAGVARPVKVTYTQLGSTATSTLAQQSLPYTNQLIGFTPTFQLDYYTNLNQPGQRPFAIRLYQAVSEKLAFAFKLEDFMLPEVDFGFFANNSNAVFDMVFPEVS